MLAPSLATAASTYAAPERAARDFNGVDLGSGIWLRSDTHMTIGDPGAGGLAWSYGGIDDVDSYAGKIIYSLPTSGGNFYEVTVGMSTVTFYQNCSTTTCYSGAADDATLVKSGSNWIYTSHDGSVYTFDVIRSESSFTTAPGGGTIGKLLTVARPNGVKLTYNYTLLGGGDYSLASVVSNTGYALKYSGSPWTVRAVNLLAHSCDAAVNCDAYDASVTMGSFTTTGLNGYSYGGTTVTNPGGGVSYYDAEDITTYQDSAATGLLFYKSPAGYETDAVYDTFSRVKNITTSVGTWNYTYSDGTLTLVKGTGPHTVTLKDPGNATFLTAVATKLSPHVTSITDPLSRQTTSQWQNGLKPGTTGTYYYLPTGKTLPEGNYSTYAYDARGNVTSVTSTPKSGSGLSATTIYAGYDTTCANVKTCNQPNWTKDAKGNQTDYTYDSTHGGVLTVTLPADQNSLRKRTYNTYTAFDTGNGYIYRLTRSETCGLNASQLALTACPNTSDTLVTVMDYGTSTTAPKTYKSFQPYTVTQTHGGTSPLTVTTSYTYDNVGNVTVIDGPRTDVDDKVYKTYDANRRVIFEIGVLPGGSNNPKRTVARHWYNGDGQETKTDIGYASGNATDGSDFIVTAFTRMTYDAAGRLIKTEQVQP